MLKIILIMCLILHHTPEQEAVASRSQILSWCCRHTAATSHQRDSNYVHQVNHYYDVILK